MSGTPQPVCLPRGRYGSASQGFGAPIPKEKRRLPNQIFFPAVLQYFTETEWGGTSQSKDIMACISLFVDRMLQPGGRNCSEQCMAKVLSVSLYICSNMKLDDLSKSRLLAFAKVEYKRRGRRARQVQPYLTQLPDPETLQRQLPDLFNAIFSEEPPQRSKVDMTTAPLPIVACRVSKKQKTEIEKLMKKHGDCSMPLDLLQRVMAMQQSQIELLRMSSQQNMPSASLALKDLATPTPLPDRMALSLHSPKQ